MPFRLKGKKFHLIYSQCGLDADYIFDHLKTTRPVIRARIAYETHEDGSPHRHVAIEFSRPWDTRRADAERIFDIDGFHPSIKPIRVAKHWTHLWEEYLTKEDSEPHDFGEEYIEGETTEVDTSTCVSRARELSDFAEYLEWVEREKRNPYLARLAWQEVHRADSETTLTDADIDHDELRGRISDLQLQDLEYDGGVGPRGPVSWILQGPSSIGKTSWAKLHAPKPALWVTHPDVLKAYCPRTHKSIIFDDVSFRHRPRSDQLKWVDRREPASVHLRNVHKTIAKGVHRFFCCNDGDDNLPVILDGDDAMAARTFLINL